MMKKIDARIAELEAEEKAEKEALDNEPKAYQDYYQEHYFQMDYSHRMDCFQMDLELPFWNTDFGYGKNNETIPKAEVTSHEQRPIKLFSNLS